MGGHYSFATNPDADLVEITIGGFFEPALIDRFATDRVAAYRRLRCAPNRHVTLVDMRGMEIQTQEAVGCFGALLRDPQWRSRALAFVVSPTLARSQIARVAAGRTARYFTEVADAKAWLLQANDGSAAQGEASADHV